MFVTILSLMLWFRMDNRQCFPDLCENVMMCFLCEVNKPGESFLFIQPV